MRPWQQQQNRDRESGRVLKKVIQPALLVLSGTVILYKQPGYFNLRRPRICRRLTRGQPEHYINRKPGRRSSRTGFRGSAGGFASAQVAVFPRRGGF
jgi:hypothetical protein